MLGNCGKYNARNRVAGRNEAKDERTDEQLTRLENVKRQPGKWWLAVSCGPKMPVRNSSSKIRI